MSNETVQPNSMTGQNTTNAASPAGNPGAEGATNAGAIEKENQNIATDEKNSNESNLNNYTEDKKGETTQEPKDMSEAFSMIIDSDTKGPEDSVQSGEEQKGLDEKNGEIRNEDAASNISDVARGDGGEGSTNDNIQPQTSTEHSESDQTNGEPTNGTSQFNRQQYIQSVDKAISDNVERQIVNAVKQMPQEEAIKQGIKLYDSNELIDKEAAKDGYIQFINPDTKEPFADRAKAEEWVNYVNNQARAKLNQLRQQLINQTREQAQGGVELQIFINEVYNKETREDVKKELMNIIAPYAVRGADGQPYKFNCNLNQAYQMAINNVKANKYDAMINGNNTGEPAKPDEPASTPPLDAKTSRGTVDADKMTVNDIKTLSDALKFEEQQRLEKEKNNG